MPRVLLIRLADQTTVDSNSNNKGRATSLSSSYRTCCVGLGLRGYNTVGVGFTCLCLFARVQIQCVRAYCESVGGTHPPSLRL